MTRCISDLAFTEGWPLLASAALGHLHWEMDVGGRDSGQALTPGSLWAPLWIPLEPGPRLRVHAASVLV